jgi:DNA (cytosine-5)-methyltransferase 1
VHDPVYRALSGTQDFVSMERLIESLNEFSQASVERRLAILARDFEVEVKETSAGVSYKLGQFKGFTGQADHTRHEYMEKHRSRVS